jgi:O-methyltransferase
VYQSAKDVLEWVWPKLSKGGIVVFDDYGFKGCDGVARLVNEEKLKKDRICIYNLNGHAVFIKTT